jgi:GNAT superfamily N-acetyltransferase
LTAPSPDLVLRPLTEADVEPLADLWTDGWRAGHTGIVPAALLRHRTRDGFRARIVAARDHCRVAGPEGAPTGFVRIEGDELDQFYVRADLRGTGLAPPLMAAAEALMREAGTRRAWLACRVGNDRAARFYGKCGWREVGVVAYGVETLEGPFELDVWRFEKDL